MNKTLMYHSVGGKLLPEPGAQVYRVPVEKFRKQLEYIAFVTRHEGRRTKVTITFDDGLLDNYTHAYPLIKEFGLKAYFFVMPAKIGSDGYMSWEQLKELKANGMTIGSHGMSHKILTNLSAPELRYELFDSKKLLEEKLGCPVDYFSIPRGFNRKKIIKMAKEAGYKKVFTSDWRDNDGYSCGRFAVLGRWSEKRFVNLVNNGFTLRDKLRHDLKNSAKGMLGASGYDKLRSFVIRSI